MGNTGETKMLYDSRCFLYISYQKAFAIIKKEFPNCASLAYYNLKTEQKTCLLFSDRGVIKYNNLERRFYIFGRSF